MSFLFELLKGVLVGLISKLWTRNKLPQGGVYEKSDSAPSKPAD